MNKQNKITMNDIASLAGVSPATVSRALKNDPRINKQTTTKIQKIANDLNYSPDKAASNFRTQKSDTLAVVFLVDKEWGHEISDPFLMALLGYIAEEASNTGYDLLLATNTDHIKNLCSHFIDSRRTDGIIVIGQGRNDPRLLHLQEKGAPFIVWGAPSQTSVYPVVGSDNKSGGYQATKRLLNNGRKNICFLGDSRHPEVRDRLEGYKMALHGAGIDLDERLIITTEFTCEDGYNKIKNMIDDKGLIFDAVFAASDSIAIGALRQLQEREISIPDTVDIMGFDDSPIATYCTPGLTTIRQDIKYAGKLLVQNLIKIISGEKVEDVLIPTWLVHRQTCK